jgi:MtrB/PioB family decaheme-associated outer membrane protein
MPIKAPAIAAPIWWYEGYAEIGGRAYLNNPDRQKLGRFFRYEDWSPGVFGNFFVGAHKTGPDPIDIEAWGKNIGWTDQAFGLDIYKPGTYYLTFGWDETPHNYAFDAKTTFGPIGSNTLSSVSYPTTTPAAAQAVVNANTNVFNLGFRRDTASAAARWTPTDNWDITADYSHMHREGTQALSAVTFSGAGSTPSSIQLPKPVNDTTQNGNLKAEYAGSSPWNKPFNVALGYGISVYNDQVGCDSPVAARPATGADCLNFQNPWAGGVNAAGFPLWNRYGLPPDNQAHSFSATGGVGLPLNSRYMGTFQYTWMTQDDPFLPSTINAAVAPATLPRSSLGGDARTMLINNVVNTQITSDLTSNLRYRYYDYHSNTAQMRTTGLFNRPDSNAGGAATYDGVPGNFNKQNASEELVYRPWKWLDVGAAYEFERWQHQYLEPDDLAINPQPFTYEVTKENAGRAFFDAKWGWSTLRTSVRYSQRRLDSTYVNITDSNVTFRTIDLQDRNSTVIKSSWDITVTNAVTITPNGGYRLDNYPANGLAGGTSGVSRNEVWNAGADIGWTITPMAALYVSYTHEDGNRNAFESPGGAPVVSRLQYRTRDLNDVITFGGKYTAIPDKLFLNASYAFSRGNSKWASDCGPTGVCNVSPQPTYPDIHNINQRIDASAKYMLDPMSFGLLAKAQPYVKARVVWERNSNDSWQNVEQQLGWGISPTDANMTRAVFLGMSNPNYDVVVGMLSFGMKW